MENSSKAKKALEADPLYTQIKKLSAIENKFSSSLFKDILKGMELNPDLPLEDRIYNAFLLFSSVSDELFNLLAKDKETKKILT